LGNKANPTRLEKGLYSSIVQRQRQSKGVQKIQEDLPTLCSEKVFASILLSRIKTKLLEARRLEQSGAHAWSVNDRQKSEVGLRLGAQRIADLVPQTR